MIESGTCFFADARYFYSNFFEIAMYFAIVPCKLVLKTRG